MTSKNKIVEYLVYSAAILAFLGFSDAAYLTVTHYSAASAICVITSGCDVVLRSPYSELFGVPIALFGALYYAGVLAVALVCARTGNTRWLAVLIGLVPVGFLASAYFMYLQAAVLGAYCSLCLLSASTSTLLFVDGIILAIKYNQINDHAG